MHCCDCIDWRTGKQPTTEEQLARQMSGEDCQSGTVRYILPKILLTYQAFFAGH